MAFAERTTKALIPGTGLETGIGILKMGIFKTIESIVIDGLGSAGNAHPGDICLVSVEQQGDHSLCEIFAGLDCSFCQITA